MTVLQPETISEQLFPNLESATSPSNSTSNGSSSGEKVETSQERGFPTASIATHVISDSLDTQSRRILAEYNFGESGALLIGRFVDGISGELRISPDGLVAKNKNGETTFTLDATTGDATFKGILAAGSLIAGSRVYITERGIIVNDGYYDRIIIGEWDE